MNYEPLLLHERLSLAIYHQAESQGHNQWYVTTIGGLSSSTGVEQTRVVEELKRLCGRQYIGIQKWFDSSGFIRYTPNDGDADRKFFYSGGFQIKVEPEGRPYFEAIQQRAELLQAAPVAVSARGLVFISCGQFTAEEISLGKELAAAVEKLTPHEGYFAETQNSLLGLSQHIFGALKRMVAFVAVMHHRGKVETLSGHHHIRGSVWIEQEIAIAAFLAQIQPQNNELPVLVYIQNGIKREGVREQLRLNPVYFESERDVLLDFTRRLQDGAFVVGSREQAADPIEDSHRRLVAQELSDLGSSHLQVLRYLVSSGETSKRQLLDRWPDAEDVLRKDAIVISKDNPATWSTHSIKSNLVRAVDQYLSSKGS